MNCEDAIEREALWATAEAFIDAIFAANPIDTVADSDNDDDDDDGDSVDAGIWLPTGKSTSTALLSQAGLSNGSRGSSENLRTMGSNDSGRGNSLEGSTSKRDAVVGYSGPLGSSSNSSKGIPSVAESSTDSHYSAELGTLKHEVHGLRLELVKSKEVIVKLQQKEHAMIERLSDQARRQLERGSKFENLSLGEQRPTQLIRQYGNLYMQVRVEALDALDNLREMDDSDDLKSKLAFSVVVLSFRSVRSTIEQKKAALRHILGIPSIGSGGSSDPAVTDMLESIGYYMRKSTEKYDIRPNVQDVCSQLYSTLFDFPSLSTCHGLTAYIEECVKLAWALSNQIPAYCIEYDANAYNANFHERFHNSNPYSDHVISYLWPALREGEKGPCVYKAIVIT